LLPAGAGAAAAALLRLLAADEPGLAADTRTKRAPLWLLLLLLLAAWVYAHEYLCLLKDIPADACSRSQLDEVGQQTLQQQQTQQQNMCTHVSICGQAISPSKRDRNVC
jgi:hypothetical protein